MSKFIVVKSEGTDLRVAIRKEKVDGVTEGYDEEKPATVWVGDESYPTVESFDSVLAKLEE